MINEILVHRWAPVIPLPLMTQEQIENELERIYRRMLGADPYLNSERHSRNNLPHRGPKFDSDREFDRGFKTGQVDGFQQGYALGRSNEAKIERFGIESKADNET